MSATLFKTSSAHRLKPLSYAVLACLCLTQLALPKLSFAALEGNSQTNQTASHYSIAAGSLGSVLSQFASQNNLVLSFDAQLTRGYSSQGLQGNYDVVGGFAQIVSGTPFSVEWISANQYRLVASSTGAQVNLQSVTVIATQQLAETTENTGSYTTGSMGTATKLPMSIRETPQSVTVITKQRIDDQNMTNITDVVRSTPGLFLNNGSGPGRPEFTARGFSLNNIMYDGLPSHYEGWVISSQANMAMFDRVEVVRGATGLVTGAGTPSAAINLVRKRPTVDPQASITADVGRWDDYRLELDASSALNDEGTLRGRMLSSSRDTRTFRDGEKQNHDLLYLIGEADLTEQTTLTLGFSKQKDKTNFFWGGLPLTADGKHMDLSRSTNPANDWERKKQDLTTLFGEIEHRFDNDWHLRFAATKSWQDGLFRGTYIARNATHDLNHSLYQSKHWEKQSALDAYLSGPFNVFGREHELVVGSSWRRNDMTTYNYKNLGSMPISSHIDFANWSGKDVPKPSFERTGKARKITTQEGLYLTSRFSLADSLKLIVGGRLDWYEVESSNSLSWTNNGDNFKVTRNLTRYAGLIYDVDNHHSVYASYTDIFMPQANKDTAGKLLDPMTGENYEIGIKGEYYDGALNTSLAVFRINQKDRAKAILDQRQCPSFPAESCYEAAGLVRSEGFELEIQGALTEAWQVGAGYTYTKAKYIKDANLAREGKPFDSSSPTKLFKLTTTYNLPGQYAKWRVGANLYWQNQIYNDASHDGISYRVKQGAYAITDFMVGYAASEQLDFQLNMSNIFDKKYYQALASDVRWGSSDNYGEPRNYHLTMRYKF
ncbi:TonB-dependent siderophore receptor [Pseudomonas sp. F1_0610]|uniref:TonB-dependent siderophore receptor n=1 Tax=Pseudomonas sp. F1_0610 TaxID=3114284 RepID=UPI0039C3C24C